ncbi:PKD domain-containing protein [Vibrio sp. SCSIO 43136]|uniref:PKD domain-containing protein n=1 Tax=Vibrio sp. SCSIO 43136 TaxID=2819101 RepID=UPI0020751D08|nr:PKD domain-containing protein [Vibrio sp. SCSIO 43136]USD68001.1 PKD domain-containing protein [Vibrio sp. SCSIO 43136]
MKRTVLSGLIATAILGGFPSFTVANTVANISTSTESVSASVSVTPGAWYSSFVINLNNSAGQDVDLAGLQVEVAVPENGEISSVWGNWPSSYSVEAKGQKSGKKVFLITHQASSVTMQAGASTTISGGVSSSDGVTIEAQDVQVLSVTLKNDPAVTGKVTVNAPSAPHSSLGHAGVLVEGEGYSEQFSLPWGTSLDINNLQDGLYTVTPLTVTSDKGYAHGKSSIDIEVDAGQVAPTAYFEYQPFIAYAQIDVIVPSIPNLTQSVTTTVRIKNSQTQQEVKQGTVTFGQTLHIEKLDDGSSYDFHFDPITVNNQQHQLSDVNNVGATADSINEITTQLSSRQIDDADLVTVATHISGLPADVDSFTLKLISPSASYFMTLTSDATSLPYKIANGQYQVAVADAEHGGVNYVLANQTQLTVSGQDTVLNLAFKNGVKLAVKGFPDFVANGTVTNDSEAVTKSIGDTKVDAIFKYAGFSGSGDPGVILEKSSLPLHRTMANAKLASSISGKHVLPVMVVYTANASGGATWGDLTDQELLYKHYATFITQAWAAQEYAQGNGHSPMSFVLNPDFLGELQKNASHVDDLNRAGAVDVNAQLANALGYMQQTYGYQPSGSVPSFENTLNGYIQSLNYIMKVMAPDVSFGWQINLWAVGSANWVHSSDDQSVAMGQRVGDFVNQLQVYSQQYKPDYIVFDKYERDGFGSEAIGNYAYNATSWQRYLDYVKTISDAVDAPAMIWQIPGGHIPTQEEGTSLIQSNHQASGGTFFMGDDRINADIDTVYTGLLDKPLNAAVYNGASNVRQLLDKDAGYDWSYRRMAELPEHNVFSLFWGGGSTTSVVSIGSNGDDGGWLKSKVADYVSAPTCLTGVDCDGSIWGGGGTPPDPTPDPDNRAPVISLIPTWVVAGGETLEISASATDTDGDVISYQWQVPAQLTVVSGLNEPTLSVTAPAVATQTSYTVSLTASDGKTSTTKATQVTVKASSNSDDKCSHLEFYQDGQQYQPQQEVRYLGNHYQAQRWTDVGKAPDQPWTGWKLLGSCK